MYKISKMGIIRLKNIRVFAYHGCLVEESKIGSDYSVDLTIEADFSQSCDTDELIDTVDYVHLNKIVCEEMGIRSKLLEHVAKRINTRVLNEIQQVTKTTVEVSKINPPIGGDVERVTAILEQSR